MKLVMPCTGDGGMVCIVGGQETERTRKKSDEIDSIAKRSLMIAECCD